MPQSSLWPTTPDLEDLNRLNAGTLGEAMGMRYTAVGRDFLQLSMPVNERTIQPAGLLHGGASAALAETVGSVASHLIIDRTTSSAVGTELNCSHLRGARDGWVHGRCEAVRVGRRLHVWQVDSGRSRRRHLCGAPNRHVSR